MWSLQNNNKNGGVVEGVRWTASIDTTNDPMGDGQRVVFYKHPSDLMQWLLSFTVTKAVHWKVETAHNNDKLKIKSYLSKRLHSARTTLPKSLKWNYFFKYFIDHISMSFATRRLLFPLYEYLWIKRNALQEKNLKNALQQSTGSRDFSANEINAVAPSWKYLHYSMSIMVLILSWFWQVMCFLWTVQNAETFRMKFDSIIREHIFSLKVV